MKASLSLDDADIMDGVIVRQQQHSSLQQELGGNSSSSCCNFNSSESELETELATFASAAAAVGFLQPKRKPRGGLSSSEESENDELMAALKNGSRTPRNQGQGNNNSCTRPTTIWRLLEEGEEEPATHQDNLTYTLPYIHSILP